MRIRPLKPSFFKNEAISECSPWARLLLQGLWAMADANGRLEYRPKRIKAEVFPHDDAETVKVENCIEALCKQDLLMVYEAKGGKFIQIPQFRKHARPHPKEPVEDIPPPPRKTIPATDEPCKNTADHLQETAKCVVSGILSLVSGSEGMPNEPEQNTDEAHVNIGFHPEKVSAAKRVAEHYFRKVTSDHGSKQATATEVVKVLDEQPHVTESDLVSAIDGYAKHCDDTGKSRKHRFSPRTFFREHWEEFKDRPPPSQIDYAAEAARLEALNARKTQ